MAAACSAHRVPRRLEQAAVGHWGTVARRFPCARAAAILGALHRSLIYPAVKRRRRNNGDFVDWFRQSSPYIHAHRGKVVVLSFGGEALGDDGFANLVHDIALLNGLGIRLVLVPGARPQIEQRLAARGADMQVVNGLRVTDDEALACVKEANGVVRVEIEALLSMGLANSPMAGVRIRVGSGNFVAAKPLGVIDGIDYQHTGEVRRVDAEALRGLLATGSIALVPGLGYSPTGEVFNLSAADVAGAVAAALNADKLIFLTEHRASDGRGRLISSMVPREVDLLLARRRSMAEDMARVLQNAAAACRAGVHRVHILDRHDDGILLSELFTRDGAGTLVTAEPYELTRTARIEDVGGILELIAPMEAAGVLVKRSRELLEQEIDQFTVIERDGAIIGCAALYPFPDEGVAELACVAIHGGYRGARRGDALLAHIEGQARKAGIGGLFVLSTRTSHWFRERGFQSAGVEVLPRRRRDLYNWRRNSKVYIKSL
ncbi:MAG: amino-acid N-acetyltransferase [Gammaproteobacteria bacterium]|nr:amino-acid N-acetyltransferase [Gammaproteobacteria bacterium]